MDIYIARILNRILDGTGRSLTLKDALAEIMLDEKQKAEDRYEYEMCTIDAMIAKKDIDEMCGAR